jgi:glycosyltransferase involved in cell wall biosynthesis
MRILHISTRLILGGSQENTVLSCEGQARLGHDVHLAFGPIYGPEGSLLDRVRDFRTDDGRGITAHTVPHLLREVSPVADSLGYRELSTLIRDLKPDIVHTHSSKAGVLGRAAAWAAKACAVVHTIHGPPFMPIEGAATRRAKVRLNNALYTRAERFAAKRCHLIVSVADAMTAQFLARGIGRPEQYVTVRSGMETAPFLTPEPGEDRPAVRTSLGLRDDDFVVGTVARLAQHKGHDDLLDALKDTRDPRLVLLWVGDGWWKDRLVARARGMGFGVAEGAAPTEREGRAWIVLTGLVPLQRVPALMRAMDVLAHPSYREGLPRTVPQALLCGVCPVAYDCDGTGEAIVDAQTGRLVRTGDVRGLGDAILRLRDHPRDRSSMAQRGREACRGAFSAEAMVAQLERVYARALDLARAG